MNEKTGASGMHPAVDTYIAQAAPFARPILTHLRHVVHAACPEVVEKIKWGMPFFVHHGNLCHMAAFKAHCAFGFWRGKELPGGLEPVGAAAMGSLGRLAALQDLPSPRKLTTMIESAIELNETSRPTVRTKAAPKTAIAMPADVAVALAANETAGAHFAAFAPGAQRDYLEWIVEARRAETRAGRVATLVVQCAEGKTRHWKYQR